MSLSITGGDCLLPEGWAPADLRIAVHLCADELASTVGMMSHFDVGDEALDDLGERLVALLARIEVLELAQAWNAARADDADARWPEFLDAVRVA